jgi:heme/copper-type cytochrome/quinol oxidase subunit 1
MAFIVLVVFSLPIGFHHLYMDPEQAKGWKLLHGVGTFIVALPTLVTGFTVIASLEIAGRLRGGKGLFGWIGSLPWTNPMTLAVIWLVPDQAYPLALKLRGLIEIKLLQPPRHWSITIKAHWLSLQTWLMALFYLGLLSSTGKT